MSKPKLRHGRGKRIAPWSPFGVGSHLAWGECKRFHPDEQPCRCTDAALRAAWAAYESKVRTLCEGEEPWAASNL